MALIPCTSSWAIFLLLCFFSWHWLKTRQTKQPTKNQKNPSPHCLIFLFAKELPNLQTLIHVDFGAISTLIPIACSDLCHSAVSKVHLQIQNITYESGPLKCISLQYQSLQNTVLSRGVQMEIYTIPLKGRIFGFRLQHRQLHEMISPDMSAEISEILFLIPSM